MRGQQEASQPCGNGIIGQAFEEIFEPEQSDALSPGSNTPPQ